MTAESYLARRRGMKGLLLAFFAALLIGATLATPARADVREGRTIETFHGIEFVGLAGYPANEDVLVEVVRGEVVIGKKTMRTDGEGGLEINHVGGADCWESPATPDILPGDTIRTTASDGEDTSAVRDIFIDTEATTVDTAANTITMKGHVRSLDNAPINVNEDVLELRMNANGFTWDSNGGRRDLRAQVSPADFVGDGDGDATTFTHVFDLAAPALNQPSDSQKAEDNGFEQAFEWSAALGLDEEATPPEITVYDGEDLEVADCPVRARYAVTSSNPAEINALNAGQNLAVSGSSFGASEVRVELDDSVPGNPLTATGAPTPASNGQSWTVTFNGGVGALADGTLTAKGFYTLPTGEIEGVNLQIKKDTQPPPTPSVPDLAASSDSGSSNSDNITNDNTPTFTGTADPGSTVKILVNGVEKGSGVATGGNYSITTSQLGDGAHPVTATATDPAGNASAASGALNVTIDTAAPTPMPTADLAPGSDTGVSDSDNLTNDRTPTITGSTEGGVDVKVLADGDAKGNATSAGDGTYSVTTSLLAPGSRAIRAEATDTAGNRSTSDALNINIDVAAPNVAADRATGSHDAPVEVGLRSNDAGAAIFYTLGTGAPDIEFTASIRVANKNTIRALARDRAGNESNVASFEYIIRKPTSVTLNMSTTTLALGGVKRFSGVVSPAHNTSVRMIVRKNGVQVLSKNLPLNNSRFASSYKPDKGVGRYSVTIVFPKDADSLSKSVTKSFRVIR